MKILRLVSAVFILSFCLTSPVTGESLWVDGPSLVQDLRPSSVGDIVTVSVAENTRAKDEAKTDLSKESEGTVSDGFGILDFIRKLGFSAENSMEGDGSTERTHDLDTTITCMVTEVLPGGNLRLEGRKDIKVQSETMTLQLEGIVRPRDVGADNIVKSDRMANVTVKVDGIGSISDLQHPGLLTKLFNAIF